MRELTVGPFGMRGRVDHGLDLRRVIDLVSAFGTWLEGAPVVVARDTRPSSPMIACAAISALSSAGCEVLDAGICPTATAQSEGRRRGAAGVLSITASHNDASWNGIKFFGDAGRMLVRAEGSEILDLWHQGEFIKARHDRLGAIRLLDDVIENYIERIVASVDWQVIARARLRIVIDAGNGAGAMVVPQLCHQLGVDLIPISCEPSGVFPRLPDPTSRSLAQAAAIMRPVSAHVGFGFSSDCERVSVITDSGEALGNRTTLPLVVDTIEKRRDEDVRVVASVCCDSRVDKICDRKGFSLIRGGVGIQTIVQRMLADDAIVGGSATGGVAFASETCFGFDGVVAMTKLIYHLAQTRATAQDLADALPRVYARRAKVACSVSGAYSAVARIRASADGRVTDLDGVRVELSDGAWYHVRVSQTEPVIRITCEANSVEAADELLERLKAKVAGAIHGA